MDTCVLGLGIQLAGNSVTAGVDACAVFSVVWIVADNRSSCPVPNDQTQSIAFKFESRGEIFWVALAAVGFFLLTSTAKRSSFFAKLTIMLPYSVAEQVLPYIEYGLVALIITLGFLVRGAEQKLHAAVAVSLMAIFWIIITLNNLMVMRDSKGFAYFTAVAMIIVLPVILLSVAPAKAVSRRLIFLALGLILLIALNELSKLGLDVSAPKLHG